jgi:hypothetical protein
MTFNLTETITISNQEELDAALEELSAETDPEWLETLRSRAQEFIDKNEE